MREISKRAVTTFSLVMVGALLILTGVVIEKVSGERPPGVPERSAKYGTESVRLDLEALPNADCWYEVGMRDVDGKPGGAKTAHVEPMCP